MSCWQKILSFFGLYKKSEPIPSPVTPITPAPKPANPPAKAPTNLEETCPAPGVFEAVDLSQYCTQRFLDTMKYLGVKTIIRYYDWPGSPTLPQKIPTAAELALIKKNDFQFCGVFQHSNNRISSFSAGRGKIDAGVAIELAKKWGQPKGSAIYFGVDFDPSQAEINNQVKAYAAEFYKLAKSAGFRVGAYGSGLTLETLVAAGYVELTWLSMSAGFRKSKEYAESGRWNLKQTLDRDCGGLNVDFDYVNPAKPDFGQWRLP